MGQTSITTKNPLPAGGIFNSGLQMTALDYPFLAVTVTADQSGTLYVYEQNMGGGTQILTAKAPLAAGATVFLSLFIQEQYYQIQFVNGSTAQSTFSLTYNTNQATQELSQIALLRRILRELQAQSLLLASFKESSVSQVNVDYGTDSTLAQ